MRSLWAYCRTGCDAGGRFIVAGGGQRFGPFSGHPRLPLLPGERVRVASSLPLDPALGGLHGIFFPVLERLWWWTGFRCWWWRYSACAKPVADDPFVEIERHHVLASGTVVRHVGVGFSVPDPCPDRASVSVHRHTPIHALKQCRFGQHLPAFFICTDVVYPTFARAVVDDHLLQIFPREVAFDAREVDLDARQAELPDLFQLLVVYSVCHLHFDE